MGESVTPPLSRRAQAATLAVGTEVTDGQILDRNSAWISHKLVTAGAQVIEHRAVADDRPDIERALRELSERADLLFVTGGLGPTSDDFTRDLISSVFARPLQFDQGSWDHLSQHLKSRNIIAGEIQKQQCYFPQGARILTNPAGTANGFVLDLKHANARSTKLYALPGPPTEIAAIWEKHLVAEMAASTPPEQREKLFLLRFLGRGESQVAEVAEELLLNTGLRIGYRAHVPYVEVKLWAKPAEEPAVRKVLAGLESRLAEWLINRDDEDVSDSLIARAMKGEKIHVVDCATRGLLAERLAKRLNERLAQKLGSEATCSLSIETRWSSTETAAETGAIVLTADEAAGFWRLKRRAGESAVEVKPAFNYKLLSERGRKFITEKALVLLGQ